jgi:hypothetical protein
MRPMEGLTARLPNGLELRCPVEVGRPSSIVAHDSGQGRPPYPAARRVSFSELLGSSGGGVANGSHRLTRRAPAGTGSTQLALAGTSPDAVLGRKGRSNNPREPGEGGPAGVCEGAWRGFQAGEDRYLDFRAIPWAVNSRWAGTRPMPDAAGAAHLPHLGLVGSRFRGG